MSCPSPTIPCTLPSPHTFANSSPSSQHALLDHHHLSPFLDPPVTSHLMFSNRAISITAPRLWNDLPPELRSISSPPPPSITKHHLHLPPLSVTPRAFHSKLKSHLFNHSYSDPSDHSPSPSQKHPP